VPKYKVLMAFRDIHTNDTYKPNTEIEMTVKRANEVEKNLNSSFLVRIQETDDKKE
jgi:hypothetical protein